MRLHVLGESLLRSQIEFNHGIGQRLSIAPKRWYQAQHGSAEGAVDLLEGGLAGVVDIDDGNVTEQTVGERLSAGVCWGVASAHELDSLQGNPSLVGGAVEASLFDQLAQEGYHALGAVLVHVGQVDFVAEQHQPSSKLQRNNHKFVSFQFESKKIPFESKESV